MNLFSLFLSIIHSITIHLKTTHEYKFYFHLSDGLKTSGPHQHHCRLSSLRRQQHFFQPLRTRRLLQSPPLTQIAKRYGQNVNTLVTWNNLPNASQIEVGQVLRVRRHVASRNTATQQRQATAVTPINRLSLQWPTDNASSSIIQRYNGTSSKGIDIAGTQGQQIRSAAAGTVIYVGEEVRGYGKLILISHNDYTITAYAHNDTLLVQKDQKVQAGQVIATMGSSDTNSVKLHFEVRLNGKAVDPLPYLTRTN